MMTNINIREVTCTGCRMIASIDDDGRCEFCRRDPEAVVAVGRQREGRYALMAVLVVFAMIVLAFGILTQR